MSSRVVGLRIDVETRSGSDIRHGVYRYTEDPHFEMLVISFGVLREYRGGARALRSVQRVDLNDPGHPFIRAIQDPGMEKHAFNANFERVTLSRWLGMPTGTYLDPENWRCSAVLANTNGVFGSLDEVARAVRAPETKDAAGKALIKLFSVPMTPRLQKAADASCGCQMFHDPAKHPKEFLAFEDYCDQDVRTEAAVASKLATPPEEVQREYEMDQRINDRGIRHFRGLSEQAVKQVEVERDRLMAELKNLTGLDNPNSNQQMQGWLEDQGYPMRSLDKTHRTEALDDPLIPEDVAKALTLKGEASLSSVAKHKAALDTRSEDGRIRGSLRFYGAHTGREAGRGIQPQNLPRYEASGSDRTRLVRGRAGSDAPLIAKGTVRSSLVPAKGHSFVVADYNAIEARVLAGLAGEQWALNEFRGEGKIYEATASVMFGVDKAALIAALNKCGKCGACPDCETRNKGKVSQLALGYAGGAGALVVMGAEDAGIDIGNYLDLYSEWTDLGKPGKFFQWNTDAHDYPELIRLRDLFRSASPATDRFWKLCARAWDLSALHGKAVKFGNENSVAMIRDGRNNRVILPSGRSIWYRAARSIPDENNPDHIERRIFIGKNLGVGHGWTDTFGGKLTENITQAVARDVLFDLMTKLEAKAAKGWPGRIVLHVHDEVVLEVPTPSADQVLADTIGLMAQPPEWGKDFLIVRGEGAVVERYQK